jgi:hypothetical protein
MSEEKRQVVIDIERMTVRDMRLVLRFGQTEGGNLSPTDMLGLFDLLGRVVDGGVEDLTLVQIREEIMPALAAAMSTPKN